MAAAVPANRPRASRPAPCPWPRWAPCWPWSPTPPRWPRWPARRAALGAGTGGQAWILSSMSSGWPWRCCRPARSATTTAAAGCTSSGRRCSRWRRCSPRSRPTPGRSCRPGRPGPRRGGGAVACSLGLIGHAFPPGPRRMRATGVWGAARGRRDRGRSAGGGRAGRRGRAGASPYWLLAAPGRGAGRAGPRGCWPSPTASAARAVDLPGMLLLGAALGRRCSPGWWRAALGWASAGCWRCSRRGRAAAAFVRGRAAPPRRRCWTCACSAARTSPGRRSARSPPAPGSSPPCPSCPR